jgi:uncharacterized protein with PQ loop repeat
MPNHTRGHHYIRARKSKDPFDYVVYFFMIATPLFELPQLYLIHTSHSTVGISPLTWGFFLLASIVWSAYAIKKHLIPLIVTNVLYFVIELGIVAGIFMYQ